jgi:hypothetical protein
MMSELDERLAGAERQQLAEESFDRVRAILGHGWRAELPADGLTEVVADFIGRLPDDAGQPAFWANVAGEVSVHVAVPSPRDIRRSRGSRNYVDAMLKIADGMKRLSSGNARLLVIGDDYERSPMWSFIRVDGQAWMPARRFTNGTQRSHWEDGSSWNKARLTDYMVSFLQKGEYVEMSPL